MISKIFFRRGFESEKFVPTDVMDNFLKLENVGHELIISYLDKGSAFDEDKRALIIVFPEGCATLPGCKYLGSFKENGRDFFVFGKDASEKFCLTEK